MIVRVFVVAATGTCFSIFVVAAVAAAAAAAAASDVFALVVEVVRVVVGRRIVAAGRAQRRDIRVAVE